MIVTLDSITRRSFIARSAMALSAVARPRRGWHPRTAITLRIGVAAPGTSMSHDQRLGLDLGLDEARHAATMFGGTIVEVPLPSLEVSDGSLSAIIGGGDESFAIAWTGYAVRSHTIYMNVGSASDRLRGPRCAPAALHVVPSDAMARDAVSIAGTDKSARAEAWDASLSRFGADTLNQRFLTRFHEPMTSGAWATWFAVKVVWESALRQQSGEASRIAESIARDTTQFDGHKGSPLSFRSWDHQLRQPLYVVSTAPGSSRAPKQVPEISADTPVRDALDRLGTSARASTCRKSQ
jgi:hypothetical protein